MEPDDRVLFPHKPYFVDAAEFLRRTDLVIANPDIMANNIGTALYVTGAVDEFLPLPYEFSQLCEIIEPAKTMEDAAFLVSIVQGEIPHIRYMAAIHPNRRDVVHRAGFVGNVVVEPFEAFLLSEQKQFSGTAGLYHQFQFGMAFRVAKSLCPNKNP